MECSHSVINEALLDEDGNWVEPSEKSAFEDIDLHRYKCTLCGVVKYYSEAARKYYVEGVLSYVKGLDVPMESAGHEVKPPEKSNIDF